MIRQIQVSIEFGESKWKVTNLESKSVPPLIGFAIRPKESGAAGRGAFFCLACSSLSRTADNLISKLAF